MFDLVNEGIAQLCYNADLLRVDAVCVVVHHGKSTFDLVYDDMAQRVIGRTYCGSV